MTDLDNWTTWGRQQRGWKDSTCQAYRWRIGHLESWLERRGSHLEDATSEQLLSWVHRHGSDETRHAYRAAAVALYSWLAETGQRDDDPTGDIPAIRTRRRLPRALTATAATAVLEQATVRGPMWYVMVCLMGLQGMRVSEARRLRWDEVDDDYRTVRWVAKGGAERALPLHLDTVDALRAWRRECPDPDWIFPSPVNPGRPGSYSWLRRTLRKIGRAAGVADLTPHALRHTFAILLLERGVPIHQVRDLLGHATLATTDIYTHARPEHLRDAIGRIQLLPDPSPPDPQPSDTVDTASSVPRLRLVHNAS